MAFSCVRVGFELGHEASLRTKRTAEGFTHDWEVFVRGADGADISQFVERVVFTLHETFLNSRRVVREPPYSVRESGYAGFMLPIEIVFRSVDEPRRVRYNYDLTLQTSGPPISMVIKERFTFPNPSEELRRRLIRGGGMGVTGSEPPPVPAGSGGSSEPERPKAKGEKPPRDQFSDLFGQPIRRPEQPKAKHKAKHIPRKEVRDKPKKQSPSSSKRSTSPKRPSSPKKASSPTPTKRVPSPKRQPSPKRAATPPKRPASPKRATSPTSKKGSPAKMPRLEKETKEKKKDKKEKRGKEDRSKERKAEKETSHKKHKKRDKKRRSPSEEKKREPSPAPVVVVAPPPPPPPPAPEKPPAKQPLKMLLAELTDPDSSDSESIQSEEEPAPPPPPLPPPKAVEPARDEPRFTPAYVSELRVLQQRIMSLESNTELQQVVRMISQTGRFEITKKTFDFDLCALDRSTVLRLMELLQTQLPSAS